MSWYSEVTYFIEHLNRKTHVTAQQGLRQGCQLAPLLWAISMGYVYKTVAKDTANPITPQWLKDNTSTYADDIHMMETARTAQSLDRILSLFGAMLDALTDNHMIINATKSAFLLRHRGSFIKRWLRQHRQATPEGDVLYFRTPRGTAYRIPIREQHTYLGVKISYHSMARHTTTHRLQAANGAWQRLRGILCSASHLALADRLSLWKATILPTLMYGLAAVHPGVKDQRRMQAMIIKHARAMTKSFAHMYHETSQHVLARCGMLTATEQLRKETEALLRRLRAQIANTPFIKETHLQDLRIQAATLQATTITLGQEGSPTAEDAHAYSCDTCGRYFSSFRLLRAHEAKWHQQKTPAPSSTPFDRFAHGQDGLPTCRHCGHRFRQLANLEQHIQRNRCQVLRQNEKTTTPSGPEMPAQQCDPLELQPDHGLLAESTLAVDSSLISEPPPGSVSDSGAPSRSPQHIPPACASPTSAPTVPAEDTAALQQPLCEWPLVRQHLEAGTWAQLLEQNQVQSYLQHHCPICMQWAATPAGIKCHMTHHHADWTDLQASIRAILKGFRRHMTVTTDRSTRIDIGFSATCSACAPTSSLAMTMTANPHHAEMDLDEQEHLFFGQLGPVKRDSRPSDPGALPASLGTAKRQRVDQQDKGKGKGGKGKGKAKGKGSTRQQGTTQPLWAYNDGSGAYQSSPWTPERSLPPLGGNQAGGQAELPTTTTRRDWSGWRTGFTG